jgi:hypothetical protein
MRKRRIRKNCRLIHAAVIMLRQRTGNDMENNLLKKMTIVIILLVILWIPSIAPAEELKVVAAVEKTEVFLGESFIYQITVEGSNTPERPQLSGITGFNVIFLGGADRSSSFTLIVNGQTTVNESKAYSFQYRLTPQQVGTLTIPSVMVKAEGRNLMTEAIAIRVTKPEEVVDYKFRFRFSKTSCYVGDKVTVTAIWYFAKNVQDPSFSIPLFENRRFRVVTPETKREPGKEYITLRIGNEQMATEYSENASLEGKKYNTISFKKILIPRQAGRISVPQATVTFNGVYDYRRGRDFFGNVVNQPLYKRFVIPSNTVTLSILALPEASKPINFSGLVGNYSISARAVPLEVRVGDPITISLTLKGDGYLEDADLPPLHEMEQLSGDFKIPQDMASGEIQDGKKVFTQTLRATHEHVTMIPEISIPYFNPKSGKYEYANTKPIPIMVQPAASELTVLDMEGRDPLELQRILEVWEEGIAHNYEGDDVIKKEAYNLFAFIGNPAVFLLILIPLLVYLVLFFLFRIKPILTGDRDAMRIKKSFISFKSLLNEVLASETSDVSLFMKIMEHLKIYLAVKIGYRPGSLTFNDIEKPLVDHGVPSEIITTLKKVFDVCEASHYAGGAFLPEDISSLCKQTLHSVEEIERSYA